MSQQSFVGIISLALHVFIQIAVIVRVLLRPHREPASRIAWVVVIVALPRRYAQLFEDGTNFRTQFTSRFSF
jgi:hypothetical protein